MNKVSPCVDDDKRPYRYEPLLETESSIMFFLSEPAITSISFFKDVDHPKSLKWMKKRLLSICQANPWLVGRILRDSKKHKNVLLKTPEEVSESDIDAIMCTQDPGISVISSQTSYKSVAESVAKSSAMVKEGYNLVGKDMRVSKFSLVPVANGEVVFILSITHAVADGYTYYRILSMLTEGADIESLSFVRKHDFVPKMKKAIGEEETKALLSPALMFNIIPKMLCGPKAHIDARFVDEKKVEQAKRDAEVRCRNNGTDKGNDFVCSTNDILTSTYAQATKADLVLMAINLRKRIEEANDKDAGNYESVLTYDPPSSAAPELIRSSLRGGAPYLRVGGLPVPGFCKMLSIHLAMITNWAFPSFKADLKLCAVDTDLFSSEIRLHLPIYDPAAVVCPIAIIFRPCFGKLAVFYGASPRDLSYERLVDSGAPLGDSVNEAMFANLQ